MHKYRTHNCNELRKSHIDQEIKLSGWVHRKRDHGNLLFIDLRDHFGIVQCVFNPEEISQDLLDKATSTRYESVVTITGKITARSEEAVNKNIDTGEIEVIVKDFHVESAAEMLPLLINQEQEFPEETRLKYRFLDLRRESIHNNIILRSKVISYIRQIMTERGFLEIQTPILTSSSPEGARDFLVPSRLHPGKFYALPQAPQQFKQLLMVAGFDKYFQIAPCFRDEDARADRSPGEFYQLDLEMSFVTQDDVFTTMEPVLYDIFCKFSNKKVSKPPFIRIDYDDSMLKYGCDKPDLRNPIEMVDLTTFFAESDFEAFKAAIASGSVVRGIPAPGCAKQPRSYFDKLAAYATEKGAKGLGYISLGEDGSFKGPIAKFLNESKLQELAKIAKLEKGDVVFFVCDKKKFVNEFTAALRLKLGEDLGLTDKDKFEFCWIVNFPFYELDDKTNKIEFSHNPFSMPQGGLEVLENAKTVDDYLAIKAFQYDIVCNGVELSSGAIRNHKPEIMYKAFEICGYSKQEVDERFGAMINAFKFGAPPHGGFAPGIDRMVMLLANEPNIREIIAFPMNQQAQDLMMNAPATVRDEQLKELNIQLSPSAIKKLKS